MEENKQPIIFKVKSGGPIKNMIKIMNQLQKANRPVIIKYEALPSIAHMISLGCMTGAEYSKQISDLPLARIGETIHFIKSKPLENEPSKYISKPKHNFKNR